MLILGLDTSTRLGSVALGDGASPPPEIVLPVAVTHSESLLPAVERLLRETDQEPCSLGAVAVGAGPGSFTGVRVGAALAKGLRAARDLPLYAWSSLAAIAAGTGAAGPVCALLDARHGRVYAAGYRLDREYEELFAPRLLSVEALLELLDGPAAWTFAGEGASLHAPRLADAGGRVLPPHLGVPRAGALVWLSRRWPDHGRVDDPASWEPAYVRAPEAERGAAG